MFDELLPRIVAAKDTELLDELAEYCELDTYYPLFIESMVSMCVSRCCFNVRSLRRSRRYAHPSCFVPMSVGFVVRAHVVH